MEHIPFFLLNNMFTYKHQYWYWEECIIYLFIIGVDLIYLVRRYKENLYSWTVSHELFIHEVIHVVKICFMSLYSVIETLLNCGTLSTCPYHPLCIKCQPQRIRFSFLKYGLMALSICIKNCESQLDMMIRTFSSNLLLCSRARSDTMELIK